MGREVVDDYAATGLSLKAHPISFLRAALMRRGVVRAADLASIKDGVRVRVAGLVLIRQRPGSAKGVMFITLEDETGPLNAIVWPSLFERYRRVVFSARMMGIEGKLQREGDVIHVIVDRLVDLSGALRRVGESDGAFPVPSGRGDEVRTGGGVDQRGLGRKPRDIYIPDLRFDGEVKVKTRDFR